MAHGPEQPLEKVNLAAKFDLFQDHWKQKIVGQVNDLYVKIAKLKGAFVWHRHELEDEFFLVTKGRLTIRLRDREVALEPGEFFVVPRGTEHLPVAEEEAWVLVLEPRSTVNTGDAGGERTRPPEWI
jgi:mannose-6-phosphate isomerase-like protein (cupin superfamily)